MSRAERADRYAVDAPAQLRDDVAVVAVVALVVAGVLAVHAGIYAFGHLVLALAAVEDPNVVAVYLVGLSLTGVALYAVCVMGHERWARRARREVHTT